MSKPVSKPGMLQPHKSVELQDGFDDFEDDQSYMIAGALPQADSALHAGSDAGFDAGFDAGHDTGFDAGIEEGAGDTEAGFDVSAHAHDEYPGADSQGDEDILSEGEETGEHLYDSDIADHASAAPVAKGGLTEWVRKPANIVTVVAGLGLAGFMAYQVMGSYQRMTAQPAQPAPAPALAFAPSAPAAPAAPAAPDQMAQAATNPVNPVGPVAPAQGEIQSKPQSEPQGAAPAYIPSYGTQVGLQAAPTPGAAPELQALPASMPEPAPVRVLSESWSNPAPAVQAVPVASAESAGLSEVATLRAQLVEQTDRVNSLERANAMVVESLNELKKEVAAMSKRVSAATVAAPAARSVRRTPPVYEFVGGIEDAVWIRGRSGDLVKVGVGDKLLGYGEVTAIDKRGSIMTKTGPVKLSKASGS